MKHLGTIAFVIIVTFLAWHWRLMPAQALGGGGTNSTTVIQGPALSNYTGSVGVTGNSGNCTDVVNGVNGIRQGEVNVMACGAVADDKTLASGTMAAGSATLTAGTSVFAPTDCNASHGAGCTGTVDKALCIDQAGTNAASLCTTIVGYTSGTVVTLNATNASGGAVNTVAFNFGTDNSAAFTAAYNLAKTNATAGQPYGGGVYVPAGRYFLASNVDLTATYVNFIGAGQRATWLFLGGAGGGGNGTCGNTNTSGAQFVVNGQYVDVGAFTLLSMNNNADCVLFTGASATQIYQQKIHDLNIVNAVGTAAFETAVTGQVNPIGIVTKDIVQSNYSNIQVGPLGVSSQPANSFRMDISGIGQNTIYNNIIFGQLAENLTTGIYYASTAGWQMTTGGGNSTIQSLNCDALLECLSHGNTGTGSSLTLIGLQTGDNPETNAANSFPEWEPGRSYTSGQFIMPVSNTTVNGTCNSGAATCVLTSVTGMWVGMRVHIPGAGTGGTNGDNYYVTAINSGATTITVDRNLTNTPSAGTIVEWLNYAGHVYKNNGACTSNGSVTSFTQPTWPTTTNGTVTDGSGGTICTWVEYGPGAQIVNTATIGEFNIQGANATTGWIFLYDNATGAAVNLDKDYFSNQGYGVMLSSAGPISVTNSIFNGLAKAYAAMKVDSGSINVTWDKSNRVNTTGSNGIKCGVEYDATANNHNNVVPSSVAGQSVCGTGATINEIPGALLSNSVPSVGTCGTGALTAGSNGLFGRITLTGATACTLTPGYTCPNAVQCTYGIGNAAAAHTCTESGSSTTTSTVTVSNSGDVVTYSCGCR